MASSAVYTEIKSGLQGQFSPPFPIIDFDEIDPTLEQGTAPFMALEEVVQNEEGIGFGDPQNLCQREEGVLLVHLFTPAPHASNAARALADQVQDYTRYRIFNGVRIHIAAPPDVGMMNNGLWCAAAVALTYRREFHVAKP